MSESTRWSSLSAGDERVLKALVERYVRVHGLFRKIGQSDLGLVERIGDNILHVA